MQSTDQYKAFSPACVRWLVIPVFSTLPNGSVFTFQGFDALGAWWRSPTPFEVKKNLVQFDGPGVDNRGWFDKAIDDVAQAVIKYGIPIIAAALATTGVGAIGSVALLAWRNLAQGQSLTDAVLNAQQTKLATSSPSAIDSFTQGLAKAKSGLTDKALEAASNALPSASTSQEPKKAFYQAVQLVRAQQVQNLTVAALKTSLNTDEIYRMTTALAWGGPLSDIMTGIRGQQGDLMLASASAGASAFVAANSSSPGKIDAALTDPVQLKAFAATTTSPTGSGSGSSSGPGVGTFLAVGAAGYGLYKFGPKIMHHFSHPGQPKKR